MNSFEKLYKGKNVYDDKNQNIGSVSGIVLDLNNQKFIGLIYKKSFLNYGFFIFDKHFYNSEKIQITKTNTEILSNYYDIIGKQVKNKDLKNIGLVEDVEFDSFFNLKNIIIDRGYSISKIISKSKFINEILKKNIIKVPKKNILSIENDYIIIEDKNYIKENKKTLENISKIFINIPNPSYNINLNKYE